MIFYTGSVMTAILKNSFVLPQENANAAAISAWERRNTLEMRINFSPIKEEKSRLLMSCTLGQEMWTKMETAYSESAADSSLLLWSQFYGCKFLPGQTVVEFIPEIEQVISRLRAINRIVLLDDQIIVKVTMSLPPSLKLIFKAEWESAVTAERKLRNLTTRLVQMEKEINGSNKESDILLSKRVKTLRSLPSSMSNPLNSEMKKKRRAKPPGHAGSVVTQVTQDPTVETTNGS
jgi:hypothetical protein